MFHHHHHHRQLIFIATVDLRYKVVSTCFAPFGIKAKKGSRVQVRLQPPRLPAEGAEACERGGGRGLSCQEETGQGGDAQVQTRRAAAPTTARAVPRRSAPAQT